MGNVITLPQHALLQKFHSCGYWDASFTSLASSESEKNLPLVLAYIVFSTGSSSNFILILSLVLTDEYSLMHEFRINSKHFGCMNAYGGILR